MAEFIMGRNNEKIQKTHIKVQENDPHVAKSIYSPNSYIAHAYIITASQLEMGTQETVGRKSTGKGK